MINLVISRLSLETDLLLMAELGLILSSKQGNIFCRMKNPRCCHLAVLGSATGPGVEGRGTPVGGAPGAPRVRHAGPVGALGHQGPAHLGRVQLVLDYHVDDHLAVLVHKLLALVRDGARHVAAEELNLPQSTLRPT